MTLFSWVIKYAHIDLFSNIKSWFEWSHLVWLISSHSIELDMFLLCVLDNIYSKADSEMSQYSTANKQSA